MATVSTVMAVAGSAKVLAPASRDRVMTLSSSSSFTCSSVPFVTNAPTPTASLKVIVASRACQDSEVRRFYPHMPSHRLCTVVAPNWLPSTCCPISQMR